MTFRQLIARLTEEVSIRDGHRSTFPSRQQTAAILRGMTTVVAQALAEGASVELGDLGTLRMHGDETIDFCPSAALWEEIRWTSTTVNQQSRQAHVVCHLCGGPSVR